jgi:hypothetical protein
VIRPDDRRDWISEAEALMRFGDSMIAILEEIGKRLIWGRYNVVAGCY